jgi:hypothetical protein
VWLDDYLEHPEKYDEYFMGLWESDVGEGGEE